MNLVIASNIIGGEFNSQQVANGSSTSVLLSSIDFTVTDRLTNYSSSQQGKSLIKLSDTEDILHNGQSKAKNYDQNKNAVENHVIVNGNNKEKSSEDTLAVPKYYLFTGKIHAEWTQVYKIGAGLTNLGNTCFMNTVIQCLTYCPPLANYLLHNNDHTSKCSITGFCMMCLLQRHMKMAIGKTGEVIRPSDIYRNLKSIAKHFQFNRQEDAHEFLRYVVEHLCKSCLSQVNGLKLDSASKETTVINKIFGGYHRSQVICLRCKKKSNTFDHFMDFILDIKQNVMSLEKALEKFIQPELLQQENSYKCPKCKMKVEAQKRFSVFQAPLVATFQLKRFDYNRSIGGKITKQIMYPEKLNLRPYMSDTQGDPVWYRLNAVLVHSGPSCNAGHYYCYVKNSNNFWYIMDDARVHQVSLNQVLSQCAYVLFYIKMESTDKLPLKKCLDNKSTFLKGTMTDSHLSTVVEVNNGMKPKALSDSFSPFSNSKPHNLPNGVKKFNSVSSPNREKISFTFRTSTNTTQLSSPKHKNTSSESVSSKQSGLVPYVEDSSESSDAGENCSSHTKSNGITNTNSKPLSRTGSFNSYKSSPELEVRTKLSKPVFSSPSYSSVNNTPQKVSATDSWIVTDAPETPIPSSSSSSGVSSTTDWHVIEVDTSSTVMESKNNIKESFALLKESNRTSVKESLDSLKENNSLDSFNESNCIKKSISSPKICLSEMSPSKPQKYGYEDTHNLSSGAKISNSYASSPSAENCNFRKQIPKTKMCFLEDEEASSSIKRKHCDSNSKISKDFSHSEHSEHREHSESRYSPLPKKIKSAENSSILHLESDINSDSKSRINANNSVSSTMQQRQYVSNCDKNSRTHLVNGISNLYDNTGINLFKKSHKRPVESNQQSSAKAAISNGNKDTSASHYTNNYSYEKNKSQNFDKGNNGFLYGTEVPSWSGENHCRPSLNSGHEIRKSFDNYDNELDRGRVRKSKVKDCYHYFNQKNNFQRYSDGYSGKYNKRHHYNNNHHNNFGKYNSRYNWKSNNRNGYQRYYNQHHRY